MSRTLRFFVAAAFMAATSGLAPGALSQPGQPDFGDDESVWANDGECDDGRFAGDGMTNTPLLDDDIGHDASDCRDAWNAGDLRLASVNRFSDDVPDFGDDASEWSHDDECDDGRFVGPGMTDTTLLDEDMGHDATDCRTAWENGELRFIGGDNRHGDTPDFGDDESEWALDDECDDPRFVGPGMTETKLLREDMYHDATDCEAAWDAGDIELR